MSEPTAAAYQTDAPNTCAKDRGAAGLLGILGVLTLATGLHFLFFRPAMLPEDVRFTGIKPNDLPPQIVEWILIVFRTWGGFMAGFGIAQIGVASYILTGRRALLQWGTAIAVVTAFGRFVLSNLIIASDYLVFVGTLFGLAVVVALCLILPRRRPNRLAVAGGDLETVIPQPKGKGAES
jgi:hypothetical protein